MPEVTPKSNRYDQLVSTGQFLPDPEETHAAGSGPGKAPVDPDRSSEGLPCADPVLSVVWSWR